MRTAAKSRRTADTDGRGGQQPGLTAFLLFVGKGGGQQQEEREIGGEGVVLLIGGEGEEQQGDRGPEDADPAGAGAEIERSVLATFAKRRRMWATECERGGRGGAAQGR